MAYAVASPVSQNHRKWWMGIDYEQAARGNGNTERDILVYGTTTNAFAIKYPCAYRIEHYVERNSLTINNAFTVA